MLPLMLIESKGWGEVETVEAGEKRNKVVFGTESLSLHFLHQRCIWFIPFWKSAMSLVLSGELPRGILTNRAESSAYSRAYSEGGRVVSKSSMKISNSVGERTHPCGVPRSGVMECE